MTDRVTAWIDTHPSTKTWTLVMSALSLVLATAALILTLTGVVTIS